MILALVLLSAHLFGGHHYQTVQNFLIGTVQGSCDSGDYCSLSEIVLTKAEAFASDRFTCNGNQLILASDRDDSVDAALEFYPFDGRHIDVYFANNTDDAIDAGTKIRFGYTCQGLK